MHWLLTPVILAIQESRNQDHDSKRNYRKYSNTSRLNNTLLNDQWVLEEIKEGKKFLESNENENTRSSGIQCL
jgi:hypothetical protein